jgi:curved DNA-binding protein CbpA
MDLRSTLNYYEILDVSAHASLLEIKEAYQTLIKAFHQDNLAIYSLLSTQERMDYLKQVEEAFCVLCDSEKRKEHDTLLMHFQENTKTDRDFLYGIPSIDRVPPMEDSREAEKMLIPPDTSITFDQQDQKKSIFPSSLMMGAQKPGFLKKAYKEKNKRSLSDGFLVRIDADERLGGAFLREVRESYCVSLEDFSFETKISRKYLLAIEQERFHELPASVYVRGFITQIAKYLSLPVEKIVAAYMCLFFEYQNKK